MVILKRILIASLLLFCVSTYLDAMRAPNKHKQPLVRRHEVHVVQKVSGGKHKDMIPNVRQKRLGSDALKKAGRCNEQDLQILVLLDDIFKEELLNNKFGESTKDFFAKYPHVFRYITDNHEICAEFLHKINGQCRRSDNNKVDPLYVKEQYVLSPDKYAVHNGICLLCAQDRNEAIQLLLDVNRLDFSSFVDRCKVGSAVDIKEKEGEEKVDVFLQELENAYKIVDSLRGNITVISKQEWIVLVEISKKESLELSDDLIDAHCAVVNKFESIATRLSNGEPQVFIIYDGNHWIAAKFTYGVDGITCSVVNSYRQRWSRYCNNRGALMGIFKVFKAFNLF